MARTPFVAGNWKMNLTKAAAIELARGVAKGLTLAEVEVGVAPAFVHLDAVGQTIASSKLLLGAQDCWYEKNGAFTGEISTEMLLDLGVRFCLAGHSERRHVVKEPSELVAKKAAAIYAAGLTLIHCVGEKLEERDANQTLSVVQKQLDELNAGAINDPRRLVIAYEPVWAIGTGRSASDAQAQEVHAFIRSSLAKKWNANFADAVRVIYGGSAKPDNIKGFVEQKDIDGGLIGGAALNAELFSLVVNAVIEFGVQSPGKTNRIS